MWQKLFSSPCIKNVFVFQQFRTTYVVKRLYDVPLPSASRQASLRKKHFVYQTIEDNYYVPRDLSIVLQEYVEDLGQPGDVVSINEANARFLILTKAASYASPEKIALAEQLKSKETFSSIYAGSTVKRLERLILYISLSKEEPWTIEPFHIRSAFRMFDAHVPDGSFTLPKEKISGPNMELEGKDFFITVTVNKTEKATVRCRIYHRDKYDDDEFPKKSYPPKFPPELVFAEEQEIADRLPPLKPPKILEEEGTSIVKKELKLQPKSKKGTRKK